MKVNFKIENFREIKFEGRYIDLHNNFKFQSFQFDLQNNESTLEWIKDHGDWIPDNEFEKVTITHTGVSYFKILPVSQDVLIYERQTLSEVAFFLSGEREEMDHYLDKMQPDEDDDIIYTFNSGMILRIGCDDVILKI